MWVCIFFSYNSTYRDLRMGRHFNVKNNNTLRHTVLLKVGYHLLSSETGDECLVLGEPVKYYYFRIKCKQLACKKTIYLTAYEVHCCVALRGLTS